jgi:hypothetical protein
MLLGLAELHRNKILHRDLKPENVFIDREDSIKIGVYVCVCVCVCVQGVKGMGGWGRYNPIPQLETGRHQDLCVYMTPL